MIHILITVRIYINYFYDHTNLAETLKFVEYIIKSTKYYQEPYLIVSYGPPFSGKTLSRDFLIKKYNLPDDYVILDVDYIVMSTILYSDDVNEFFDRSILPSVNIDNIYNDLLSNEKNRVYDNIYNEISKEAIYIV